MPIRHAAMQFGCNLERFVRGPLTEKAQRHGIRVPPVEQQSAEKPLQAFIHWGRWVVLCPCNNAEFAWVTEGLVMCSECWNQYLGGQWRRVAFPRSKAKIEALLEARSYPQNRNWLPNETTADLVAENIAHGIPEGVG